MPSRKRSQLSLESRGSIRRAAETATVACSSEVRCLAPRNLRGDRRPGAGDLVVELAKIRLHRRAGGVVEIDHVPGRVAAESQVLVGGGIAERHRQEIALCLQGT